MMDGYFTKGNPNGILRIEAKNIDDFKELIERAKRESDSLAHTIAELERFDFRIDFTAEREDKA